jgi:tyrosinase
LQEQCNYKGNLAYWDWSLDWVDMAKSPIWDSFTGFGGDGDKNAERSVGHGHCITDGPFANQTVLFFGVENRSHCLSRGFIHGKHLQTIFGSKVKPEALEAVLLEEDYESFNLQLEEGPHNAIPRAIRGDFLRVTAPNGLCPLQSSVFYFLIFNEIITDPVFFLHHTQLDRMWWQWQQRDLRQRLWQYRRASNEGNGEYQESQKYSLNDDFHFGGLAPDRKVSDIMSTESELLCYRY